MTTSSLAGLLGISGGVPLGGSAFFQTGPGYRTPALVQDGPREFLQTGNLVPFAAKYANTLTAIPSLGVSGLKAAGQGILSASNMAKLKIGATYYLFGDVSNYWDSPDGITFTSRNGWSGVIPNDSVNTKPVWNGTRIVGVNTSNVGKVVSATSAGGAWAASNVSASASIRVIGWDGVRWIAMPSAAITTATPATYLTSTDGVTWTIRAGITDTHTTGSVIAICGDGAGTAYALTTNGAVYRSADGIAWTYMGNSGISYPTIYAFGVSAGRLVIIATTNSYVWIFSSANGGATWASRGTQYADVSGPPQSVAGYVGSDGTVICVLCNAAASGCAVVRSADGGATWLSDQPQILPCTAPLGKGFVDSSGWFFVADTAGATDSISGSWSRTDYVGIGVASSLYAPTSDANKASLSSYVRIK